MVTQFEAVTNIQLDVRKQPTMLLVNNRARRGRELFDKAKRHLIAAGVNLVESHAFMDSARSAELVQAGIARGIQAVIVGSGDGTISHVVDHLVNTNIALGVLPLGTANNLARTLHVPHDLNQACRLIANGWTNKIDLGIVNGNYFVNICTIGLGASVIQKVSRTLKHRIGAGAYAIAALQALTTEQPFQIRLTLPNEIIETKTINVTIANGRSFGDGFVIAPGAKIDDNELIVTLFEPMSKLELFRLALHLPSGRYINHKRVKLFRGLTSLKIEVLDASAKPINVDGDLTDQTPAHFSIVPRSLRVFVPHHHRASLV